MIAAVLGLVFGAAAFGAVMVLVPPRRDLVAVVGRWDAARRRASVRPSQLRDPDTDPGMPSARPVGARMSSRIAEELVRRGVDLHRAQQDLTICGRTLEQHIGRMMVLAVAGLFAPSVLGVVLLAAGLPIPLPVPVLIGAGLAAAMVALTHRDLRVEADRRRAEFRRSLSTYLDLVAMGLESGRGHAEALPAAAAIGDGWVFERLQDTISGARYSGITPWAALGALGQRAGIVELEDLASALTLAIEEGSQIKTSLAARAETLRDRRIKDAQGEANDRTQSMKFALIQMVFAVFAYELYPPVANLIAG